MLARIPEDELRALLVGYGYTPHFVTGSDPERMHRDMAATLDEIVAEIRALQDRARHGGGASRPRWPMIVLRTPKGWTGPKEVDGVPVEGTFRAHQVPLSGLAQRPEHLRELEAWMRSYRPEELFDDAGALRPELAALAPEGERRMGANLHANGGALTRPLELPDFRDYAVDVQPGATTGEATRVLGAFLRDVIVRNPSTFRLMGPDETASNRLSAVFEATDRTWEAERLPGDDHLAPDGRVMEILSDHLCEGWLEGYLLTGRHGLFNCYEAFIHIVDSMFNQHAKWLEMTNRISWRRPIPSLNYLLSSHHCLRSRQYVNVIVAGKQPAPQYLSMDEAIPHCTRGLGIWEWAATTTATPTSCWPAPATSPRSRPSRPPPCCASTCPICGCA